MASERDMKAPNRATPSKTAHASLVTRAASARADALRPPRSPIHVVTRPQHHPDVSQRLLLVQAPAGFGKTETLRQIWSGRTEAKFWISLKPQHRDYRRFREDIRRAAIVAQLPEPQFGDVVDEDGALWSEALCAAPGGALLVLDNYDLASSPEVDAFVRALLEHASPDTCLAVGARARPNIGAARLAAQGGVKHIRANDLIFSDEEAEAFCAGWLSGVEARTLNRYLDGWPAGFQLARSASESAGGADWRIADDELGAYVIEEGFDPLPGEVRTFLVETAPLGVLDAEMIDAMRGAGDGAAWMEKLQHAQAFLLKTEAAPGALRKSAILQRLLDRRFSLLGRSVQDELRERAAKALAQRGFVGEALGLASAMEDPKAALENIDKAGGEQIWDEAALERAGKELSKFEPPRLKGGARLALARAIGLLRDGGKQDARGLAAAALMRMKDAAEDGAFDKGEALVARALWKAHADEILSVAEIKELSNWGRRTRSAAGAMALRCAAVLALRTGQAGSARLLAEEAQAVLPAQSDAAVLARTTFAIAALCDGELCLAESALDQLGMQSDDVELAKALDICRAWLKLERSGVSGALSFAPAGAPQRSVLGAELIVEAARLSSISALKGGDQARARAVLEEGYGVAHERQWKGAQSAIRGEMLALACRVGDRAGAARLARGLGAHGRRDDPGRIVANVAYGLALHDLLQGDPDRAIERLSPLRDRLMAARWRLRALMLEARALADRGDKNGATAALSKAVRLYCDRPLAYALLEDCDELWPQLMELAPKLAQALASDRMLDGLADLVVARARIGGGAGLAPPIDEEVVLLRELRAQGGRSKAAAALNLSENTVKFYLKRLFKKWGVSDWRLAVKVGERIQAA